jgi:hypothetical protein
VTSSVRKRRAADKPEGSRREDLKKEIIDQTRKPQANKT